MAEEWAFRVLRPLQASKHIEMKDYLRRSAPRRWVSLEEFDRAMPDGARAVDFPEEWIAEMKRECARRGSCFQIEVTSNTLAGGAARRDVRLRYDPAMFATTEELLEVLRVTAEGGSSASVATGRDVVATPAAVMAMQQVVKARLAHFVELAAARSRGKQLASNADAGGGPGAGGGGGVGDEVMDGFDDVAALMRQGSVPIFLRSKVLSARGVERVLVGLPSTIRVGDRVAFTVCRNGRDSGDEESGSLQEGLRLRIGVSGKMPEGLCFVPAEFNFDVATCAAPTSPPEQAPQAGRVLATVPGAYTATLEFSGASPGARRWRLLTRITVVAPPALVPDRPGFLFAKELHCPLELPASHRLLSTSLSTGTRAAAAGETWWADGAPSFAAAAAAAGGGAISTSDLNEAAALAFRQAPGIAVAAAAAQTTGSGAGDGVGRGREELPKKRAKNFEDLANKHMLHLGLDLTRGFMPEE